MILRAKKFLFCFICFVLLLCIVFSALYACNSNINNGIPVLSSSGNIPSNIVIDPGHGGEDGGAVASDGTMEKDINLSVAGYLKDMFLSGGYSVTMTRSSDCAIYDKGINTIKEKKVSDMKNRLKIFNSDNNNTVISIHQNKFTQSQYSGTQIFFSPNNKESLLLAESIKKSVTGFLQPQNTRETKSGNKSIYLLWNANVPSVIVECGFLSNDDELKKLKSGDYQKQMAFAIYCGCLEYLNTK